MFVLRRGKEKIIRKGDRARSGKEMRNNKDFGLNVQTITFLLNRLFTVSHLIVLLICTFSHQFISTLTN
jgi:hypothetical protein